MKTFVFTLICFFSVFISSAQSDIQPAVDWINRNAVPIKTVDAGNGFDDLDKLDASIGDARIVAMGECTHGSSEIFRMKHRMLEWLVTKKGFTIFSIEANMPEAYAINEYIIEGKGDPKKLLAEMYFWTWNTQEVLDMILWMKKYNDTASKKIMFTGFDMQFPDKASANLKKYLQSSFPDALYLLDHYDSTMKANYKTKNFSKVLYPALKNDADGIMTIMSKEQSRWDNPDFKWAFQNAKILWQYGEKLQYKSLDDNGFRDKSMADNAEWIAENNPGAKIMIWAHNEHIRKSESKFGKVTMGTHLKQTFGNNYVAVGFSTEEGTYTAVRNKIGVDSANVLTPSKKWTCEYIFKQAAADNFIIDLHKAQQGDEGVLWIFGKTALRTLGARVNDRFQFVDIHPIRDYDMLLFIKHINSSKCFYVK